ncbi:MAG: superoxide dismutase family protein [Brumimicrobium sp.]|nr:superoxide dismutase family protein [Brumimicrobium sp.]
MKKFLITGLSFFLLLACKNETTEEEQQAMNKGPEDEQVEEKVVEDQQEMNQENTVMVVMGAKSGSTASGNIILKETDGKVSMNVDMKGLKPGKHAIHIHEKGDCSAEDGTSAGGHWNPENSKHGKLGHDTYHMGDIGNLEANENGEVVFGFQTDKWCLGCADTTKNIMGKAFIIHAGADDFKSQPSGAAGARVACGVISK